MIRLIPGVMAAADVAACRASLASAPWVDGRVTAGDQSTRAKTNLQVPEDAAEAEPARQRVLAAVGGHPLFIAAALPARIYPPLFNRYGEGMGFGDHIDNAIRVSPAGGAPLRTDLSATLFLCDPADYDGGELVIEAGGAARRIKGAAGDLVLYPGGTVHRVEPVTRGWRWAAFFWVQSLVADPAARELLFDLDRAIATARADLGDDHPAAISLVGVYHNLVRRWGAL